VDVIASPDAAGPISENQDKERIEVYTNLLQNGTFSSGADTAAWGLQSAPGRSFTDIAAATLLASTTDSASVSASGVWQFTFDGVNSGVKATPFANYIPFTSGKWYISRMRIAADAANTHQALLFSFSTAAANGITSDISADVFASGIPTVWTWMEAPFYIHAAQSGFPQFQLKAGGTGSVFIDEIQVIQATPRIFDGTRGNVRSFLAGGLFTNAASTTRWGTQIYYNCATQPAFSLTQDVTIGSALSANFAGATPTPITGFLGFKWTASTSGAIITPAATVGRQIGASVQIDVVSGLSGTASNQALIVAYGVPTNGAGSPLDKIEAAAEVGVIVSGTLATAGTALDPFAQVQFGMRADATGVVNFANADFIADTNDPNFGDATLFP
jgi:hypothetical protein